jgi:hypothetical protein
VNDNSGPLRENRDFVVDEAGYYGLLHVPVFDQNPS